MTDNISRSSTICLFDVDGTLTYPRQKIEAETENFLSELKKKVSIGIVGGSDLVKILEQLGGNEALNRYDYVFAENGLVFYKQGSLVAKESVIKNLGEEKLQDFINYCLEYMSTLRLPFKRGIFIETRSGLINIAPCGRSATAEERDEFERYDKIHQIRSKFIEKLKERFPDFDLTYSIGGQISFDVFPNGWDKRFCLQHVEKDNFQDIYFFGDKTFKGGNDHEIANDPRTKAFTVTSPQNTIQVLKEQFKM